MARLFKRFLPAALTVGIGAAFASCAGHTPPASAPSMPPAAEAPKAPAAAAPAPVPAPKGLPAQLSNAEFWRLIGDLSEPGGSFRSDNLLSNEVWLQHVIPDLLAIAKPDRVYMGVGPEQNFTYVAALKPAMVFITDVRRGNLDLHLMYKALFELSADRAEFVSRLFSRKRPEGLTAASSVRDIFPRAEFANFMARDKELATYDAITAGVTATYEFKIERLPWLAKGSLNLRYDYMTVNYDNFRDARFSIGRFGQLPDAPLAPGTEPLYKLNANIIQFFVSAHF